MVVDGIASYAFKENEKEIKAWPSTRITLFCSLAPAK